MTGSPADPALRERVSIGVAGWSYADWRGIVYGRSGVDELREVARLVDLVEVNTSFYRTPPIERVADWVCRTEEFGTRFSVKLPRTVTHEGRVDPASVEPFLAAFDPIRRAGRLDAVLAQYSERFRDLPRAREYLAAVASAFGGLAPLVIELRHPSWYERDGIVAVRAMGFRPAFLDWPRLGEGFDGPERPDPDFAYLRLHGRNRQHWGRRGAHRDQVYDHDYQGPEREEIQRRLESIAKETQRVHVVANNHYQGQAVAVSLHLRAWLEGSPVAVPDSMVRNYPGLSAAARTASRGLFDL